MPSNLGARGGPVPGGVLPAVASSRWLSLPGVTGFPTSGEQDRAQVETLAGLQFVALAMLLAHWFVTFMVPNA